MMTTRKFRIKKVGRRSVWFNSSYPWRMICRNCGRRAHHTSQQACVNHAQQHDCTPGSVW